MLAREDVTPSIDEGPQNLRRQDGTIVSTTNKFAPIDTAFLARTSEGRVLTAPSLATARRSPWRNMRQKRGVCRTYLAVTEVLLMAGLPEFQVEYESLPAGTKTGLDTLLTLSAHVQVPLKNLKTPSKPRISLHLMPVEDLYQDLERTFEMLRIFLTNNKDAYEGSPMPLLDLLAIMIETLPDPSQDGAWTLEHDGVQSSLAKPEPNDGVAGAAGDHVDDPSDSGENFVRISETMDPHVHRHLVDYYRASRRQREGEGGGGAEKVAVAGEGRGPKKRKKTLAEAVVENGFISHCQDKQVRNNASYGEGGGGRTNSPRLTHHADPFAQMAVAGGRTQPLQVKILYDRRTGRGKSGDGRSNKPATIHACPNGLGVKYGFICPYGDALGKECIFQPSINEQGAKVHMSVCDPQASAELMTGIVRDL